MEKLGLAEVKKEERPMKEEKEEATDCRAGAEGAEAKVRFKMLLHLHFEEQGRPTGVIHKVIAEQSWPTDDETAAIKKALASWKVQNPDKSGVCEVVAIAKNEDIESLSFRRFEEIFKCL